MRTMSETQWDDLHEDYKSEKPDGQRYAMRLDSDGATVLEPVRVITDAEYGAARNLVDGTWSLDGAEFEGVKLARLMWNVAGLCDGAVTVAVANVLGDTEVIPNGFLQVVSRLAESHNAGKRFKVLTLADARPRVFFTIRNPRGCRQRRSPLPPLTGGESR